MRTRRWRGEAVAKREEAGVDLAMAVLSGGDGSRITREEGGGQWVGGAIGPIGPMGREGDIIRILTDPCVAEGASVAPGTAIPGLESVGNKLIPYEAARWASRGCGAAYHGLAPRATGRRRFAARMAALRGSVGPLRGSGGARRAEWGFQISDYRLQISRFQDFRLQISDYRFQITGLQITGLQISGGRRMRGEFSLV